ncbi:hypothetical protein UFOVP733_23 [uncultured Caudovirales phage]|uniref:Uncharacterized protein n=1 Tax=uncultured Caudovirales phage TaxID=2100421 RepID=A0A6J5NTN7_9CAUD|nr:hypothetical protein UFOVP733_23 [uncultured Caudovirales phage]CAB5224919.1 hypothetical protein UFOVP743_36 [uncultured Caudovirales phage]
MSYNLLSTIRKLKDLSYLPASTYSVFLAIASCVYQRKNGQYELVCDTSVAIIASITNFSIITVKRHIKRLQGCGLIHLERYPQSNEYFYQIDLLAVENLKETLRKILADEKQKRINKSILGINMTPSLGINMTPRILGTNNILNNNINNNLLTTELTTEIATQKESSAPLAKNYRLFNNASIKLASCEDDKNGRNVPRGTSLDKMEFKKMHEQNDADEYYFRRTKNPDEHADQNKHLWSIDVWDALEASRERLKLNPDPNKQGGIRFIATRITKLVKSGLDIDIAQDRCLQVIKYWDHKLSKKLSGSYREMALAKYSADSIFRWDDKFFEALRALDRKGKFIDHDDQAEKLAHEKRKAEEEAKILDRNKEREEKKRRQELKLKDREYARLCDREDDARSLWVKHSNSPRMVEMFNEAVAERKNYEDQVGV